MKYLGCVTVKICWLTERTGGRRQKEWFHLSNEGKKIFLMIARDKMFQIIFDQIAH